jgi:hypothetical protein
MTNSNTQKVSVFNKTTDGIDHINVGPKAQTELGLLLSHFTESRFTHPYLGPFNSMEGYWFYVKAKKTDDRLRSLSGKAAYQVGKGIEHIRRRYFRTIIMDGNYQKIKQNDRLRELLIESTLPITQYYTFGPNNIPINPQTFPWLVNDFETLRELFRVGKVLEMLPYEKYQILNAISVA